MQYLNCNLFDELKRDCINKIMNNKDKKGMFIQKKGDYVDNNELLRFMREFIVSLMEESKSLPEK